MLVVGSSPRFPVTHTKPLTVITFDDSWWNGGWNLFDKMVQKDPLRIVNNVDAYLVCSSFAGTYSANYDKYISALA
jgi:hypothetical protein